MFGGNASVTILSSFAKDISTRPPAPADLRRLLVIRLCVKALDENFPQCLQQSIESERNIMADNTNNANNNETPTPKTVAEATTGAATDAVETPRKVNENLETEHGTTTIDNAVVSKIAGIAAREVSGVAALGGGGARLVGTIRESFGGNEDVRQGVSVTVAEGVSSIEVAIIAEYGVAIHELAEAIRRNIINAIERMTGLDVERVDVVVHDVKLPNEKVEDSQEDSDNNNAAVAAKQTPAINHF